MAVISAVKAEGFLYRSAAELVAHVVDDRLVDTVFQPIVRLDDGAVVAHEALARGPVGPLESPDQLFTAARSAGRLAELDAVCRSRAVTAAARSGLRWPQSLFVNVEPDGLDDEAVTQLQSLARAAPRGVQLVVEITERALSGRPAELLRTVERVRDAGWRVALDDVGADDVSLAFMPLLRPDVVKLDLSLVQQRPTPAVAAIMNAVSAYAETSGATVLAEGIENADQVRAARALGASLGQGWLFGRPAPGPATDRPVAAIDFARAGRAAVDESSPFGCLPSSTSLRLSTKPLLVEISKHLERRALAEGSACLVVSAFQHTRHLTSRAVRDYARLADSAAFVAVLGEQVAPEPAGRVHGAAVHADDPLQREWDIVILAPHFAAALLAHELTEDPTEADPDREFEFALTYDRAAVVAATRSLISRMEGPAATAPAATTFAATTFSW